MQDIDRTIQLLIRNLVEIKDTSGEFLLRLPDGRVIDTKGWNDWEWTHGVGLYGIYKYVPHALLALGVVYLFLGSRIYSQHLRALLAAIVLVAMGTLGASAWAVVTLLDGFLSLLGILMPAGALAAVVLAAMAWSPCVRTAEARKRAAAAGFDLNL